LSSSFSSFQIERRRKIKCHHLLPLSQKKEDEEGYGGSSYYCFLHNNMKKKTMAIVLVFVFSSIKIPIVGDDDNDVLLSSS
jgi:hypothetical protein